MLNHVSKILSLKEKCKAFLFFILLLSFFEPLYSQVKYEWSNLPIGGGGFVSALIPSKTKKDLLYARTDVGGAYRWNAEKGEWIPLMDWVSADQTGYLGVESLASDPSNPNRLYMLVGTSYFNEGKTAILKSEDYGATFKIIETTGQFKAHGNGMGRGTGEKLAVDPNNSDIIYCGTRWNGLFRSTNAGLSWSKVSSFPVTKTPNETGVIMVIPDPSKVADGQTQTIYVGVSRTGDNLYVSEDAGKTFTAIKGGPTEQMPSRAVLTSDGYLFITYGNGAGPHGHWAVPEPMDEGAVWRYNTKTKEWKNITPAGYTRPFGGISVDPNNPKRLVLSTMNTWMLQDNAYGDRIFTTTDNGETWRDLFKNGMDLDPNGCTWVDGHAIHWTGSIEFDPFDTKKVWVTSGNGVFRTDDVDAEEQVWKFMIRGFEETVPIDIESIKDGPVVSVILDYDGFTHYDVTQYAPIHQPRMGSTTGIDVADLNPNIRIRVGEKMFYTTDGGKTWTEVTTKRGTKGYIGMSADGKVWLYSPEKSTATLRSTDNGATWKTVKSLSGIGNMKPTSDPVNPNKFYVYSDGGSMMVSVDGGETFESKGALDVGGSSIIRTVPGKEGHLWVALNGGGLARSTNSGESFTKLKGVTYCAAVGLGKEAPEAKYATIYIWGTVKNVTGLHRSTDEGKTWVRINDDEHQYGGPGNGKFVIGDWNVFGRVYMSSVGRGIVMGNEAGK
jgi:photosystem II stability/assembly factor-like uncharacterized protein